MHPLVERLQQYLGSVETFTSLRMPEQIFFAVCPPIMGKLCSRGKYLVFAAIALSFLHYRAFHIILPFILLYVRIPGWKEDRNFWTWIIMFGAVHVLWVVVQLEQILVWKRLVG